MNKEEVLEEKCKYYTCKIEELYQELEKVKKVNKVLICFIIGIIICTVLKGVFG